MAEIAAGQELKLTSSHTQSNRWYHEQQKLKMFPAFALLGVNGKITAAEGALDTQYSNTYGIRIALEDYPYALPKVFPKGWSVNPVAPHKFPDGSICIMKSTQWQQYFTVALVVAKAAIWLGKYEIWKRNGHRWPGVEQPH